ncbi:MAG: NAD(P)/FAD-dependent oxidoreductase [Candidatus Heimdallarchaeota archaeon]
MARYDIAIVGAGSLGVPAAFSLSQAGFRVAVLEKNASAGQGDNKHAIGGVRATHTEKSKIITCLRSIEIFSSWEQKFGESIEWQEGGYTFVAYTEDHERLLKDNIQVQNSHGLTIDWCGPEKIEELVPGISEKGLRGGTYSPFDGHLSPLLAITSMFFHAAENGADFHFKEEALAIKSKDRKITAIKTNKKTYECEWVVNAAGAEASQIAKMVGDLSLPVVPDSHEAAISEPVQHFFDPMVVDLRPGPKSSNFYFYQNVHGQVVMCYTPKPLIIGLDRHETSDFLPEMSRRMCHLIPRMKNLRMRRTWRGSYPMTPDGSPIVGKSKEMEGYVNLVGACGQGFMLGPGLGELVSRVIQDKLSADDLDVLAGFSRYRDFASVEKLK